MAQESPDALSTRSVLSLAACVIVVYVNELSALKRLMAHSATALLRIQQPVELLLSQPVTQDAVLPVGLPTGFR
ncbi:MAG: hypothetical protein WAM97_19555 [Acidimicrobiales bacterium]